MTAVRMLSSPSESSPSANPSTSSLIKCCYRYSPSTSLSSCSISDFALECNFRELANEYPEFRNALRDTKKEQTKSLPLRSRSQCSKQKSSDGPIQNIRTLGNDENNNSSTTSSNSTHAAVRPSFQQQALSTQTAHTFNIALTRALLQHHFQLKLPSLPRGHLCPPVPNRANYVCWLRELLMRSRRELYRFSKSNTNNNNSNSNTVTKSCTDREEEDPTKGCAKWTRRGLDIGTGVSAIYPLLLTSSLFGDPVGSDDESDTTGEQVDVDHTTAIECGCRQWQFIATDIDPVAIESARINIQANSVDNQIQVIQVSDGTDAVMDDKSMEPRGPLFMAMSALSEQSYQFDDEPRSTTDDLSNYPKLDFVMTNPPFYASLKEATLPRVGDKRARTDMSANESVYKRFTTPGTSGNEECNTEQDGGDVGFITSIMNDSQYFRHRVTWYTSLVSKRSSLDAILRSLESLVGVWGNRGQIRTVEFRQRNIESSDKDEGTAEFRQSSPRVRWAIGYTYERAIGRCPSCRVSGGLRSFDVWVPATDGEDDFAKMACDEVASRLIAYFENIQGIALTCSLQKRKFANEDEYGNHSAWCVTALEERFRNSIPSLTNNEHDNENLPMEGHFVIDAFLETNADKYNENGEVCVRVILELFSHTKYGSVCVEKIRNLLPGEIGRTNRKWRRLLKQKQATMELGLPKRPV